MPGWTYQNVNKDRYAGYTTDDSGTRFHIYGPDTVSISSMLLGQEGHYGYPNFPPNSNVGGLFRMEKNYLLFGWVDVGEITRDGGNPNGQKYKGLVTAYAGINPWTLGLADASAWGTLGYNKARPAQPEMSVLNSIYELKDLPRMLRARHEKLKDIGDYYLALKFGWEPLLRDIRDYVFTQRKAQKLLAQLLRDNEKVVRRRVILQNDVVESPLVSGLAYGAMRPILPTQYYQTEPRYEDRVTTTDRVWASGAFRYWLPPGPRDVNWTRKMLARIYGATPSPSVLWNALPWTWLIDWHVNVGAILENMEGGVADRVAAQYFYCMREKRETTRRDVYMKFKRVNGNVFETSSYLEHVRKTCHRIPGYPFGFNLSPQPLTGMQLSILGALGLSKLG
nr:MAG: hypothetical protein 1 [Leviviridae sp.]